MFPPRGGGVVSPPPGQSHVLFPRSHEYVGEGTWSPAIALFSHRKLAEFLCVRPSRGLPWRFLDLGDARATHPFCGESTSCTGKERNMRIPVNARSVSRSGITSRRRRSIRSVVS